MSAAAPAADQAPPTPRTVPPIATCLGAARNATKATVYLIQRDTGTVVRKQLDPVGHGLLHRLGRFLLQREARILRQLAATGMVPKLLASGPDWLETEFVPGETLASRRKRGISHDEAKRLRDALKRFHATGWAHGDLGRRDILFAADNRIIFFDVATATGPGRPSVLAPLIRLWARRHDRHRLSESIRKALDRREAWDEQQAALAVG